jgi:general stress protein CsbA
MGFYRFLSGLYYAGMVLILAGVIMNILELPSASWVFAIGLIPVLGIRIFNFIIAPPLRKRTNGVLMLSAIFLAAAVAAIYYQKDYWIIFIAVSAVLDGYVSFRKIV